MRSVGATGVEPAWTFTLSAGYKPEGIRPGWPPRSRTERYLRIRQAPSTGWVAASRWERTRPPALARPSGFKPGPAARQVSHPLRRGRRTRTATRTPRRFRNAARGPGGFTLHDGSPARCEQARDGGRRATRTPALSRPPAFQTGTATWRCHLPRRTGDSNTTELTAQSLAATPDP